MSFARSNARESRNLRRALWATFAILALGNLGGVTSVVVLFTHRGDARTTATRAACAQINDRFALIPTYVEGIARAQAHGAAPSPDAQHAIDEARHLFGPINCHTPTATTIPRR